MFLKILKSSQKKKFTVKKRLWHRCFPVNFTKFLRTPFLQRRLGETSAFVLGNSQLLSDSLRSFRIITCTFKKNFAKNSIFWCKLTSNTNFNNWTLSNSTIKLKILELIGNKLAKCQANSLYKKWSFPLRISSVNVTKSAIIIFEKAPS